MGINKLSKVYRHESNPLEEMFHDKFILDNETYGDKETNYSRIAFPSTNGRDPVSFVTEREKQIMINTIQWLGSEVGQCFLRECGFKKL